MDFTTKIRYVYFSHYAFHIESSKKTLILCSVRQNQVQMSGVEVSNTDGGRGWAGTASENMIRTPSLIWSSWLDETQCVAALTCERTAHDHGYANCRSTLENSGRLNECWKVRYCGWCYSEMGFNRKQNKPVLNSIFSCTVWS